VVGCVFDPDGDDDVLAGTERINGKQIADGSA
jgi:hypothetical protein